MTNDPYHKARDSFRKYGPALLVVGGILTAIGIIDFIAAFISMANQEPFSHERPHFPILFIICGIPGALLTSIGMKLTGIGYLKEATKYVAKESAPAAKITTTAIRSAILDDDIPCPTCSTPIEPDSKFCSNCGASVAAMRCPVCNAMTKADARFCSDCGHAIQTNA
ncbi:MAG: zinc ribbon domain-containing protein [Phycisphaerales bacterium JB052]